MTNEIKELIDNIKRIIEENRKIYFNNIILQSTLMEQLLDYINNLQEENKQLNKERKAIKKYINNHTITYKDNGIECCKPDEYFNISWVENMLNGNFENLETLFEVEDNDK